MSYALPAAALLAVGAIAISSAAHAQGLAQQRRNLTVVQSIYNTGKHGAGNWGARLAVAKCRQVEDKEATVENFKQSIRDAYGQHYGTFKEVIESHLADPTIEQSFLSGHAFASTRLLTSNCSDLVLNQVEDEIRTGLANQQRSMRRMAATLGRK